MNASDIVKAKQSKTLYNAYYSPFLSTFISSGTTLNSCIISSFSYSTLNVVSSSVMDRGGGLFISTLEYVSCNNTVYPYQCGPNFISYEMQNAVKGEKKPSSLRWSNNTNTTVYDTIQPILPWRMGPVSQVQFPSQVPLSLLEPRLLLSLSFLIIKEPTFQIGV
jgi:hypothetical protein